MRAKTGILTYFCMYLSLCMHAVLVKSWKDNLIRAHVLTETCLSMYMLHTEQNTKLSSLAHLFALECVKTNQTFKFARHINVQMITFHDDAQRWHDWANDKSVNCPKLLHTRHQAVEPWIHVMLINKFIVLVHKLWKKQTENRPWAYRCKLMRKYIIWISF